MHALGNDFILIDETKREIIPEKFKPQLAINLCKRHESVGADGIIYASQPSDFTKYDIRYRIFNADGTEPQMCGNGARCFAKFIDDNEIIKGKKIYRLETKAGLRTAEICSKSVKSDIVKVDMGLAEFIPSKIPFIFYNELIKDDKINTEILEKEIILDIQDPNFKVKISCVNVGNPHAVFENEDLEKIHKVGPLLEKHKCFPEKTNVHCIKTKFDTNEFWSSTWERGVGHTLACGTGACACAIIGVKLGKLRKNEMIQGHLQGGELKLYVTEDKNFPGKLRTITFF